MERENEHHHEEINDSKLESDVISLGDEEEITSNPSPGPNTGASELENTFDRELTKLMSDSYSTAGNLTADSAVPSFVGDSTLENALKNADDSVESNPSKTDSIDKEIEVITLDSSMESHKDGQDDKVVVIEEEKKKKDEEIAEDVANLMSAEQKLEEAALKLAGDFGLPIGDVLVEDDDEDAPETRPKLIVPFANLSKAQAEEDDQDEEVEDESIFERICALSEMFPDSVRTGASAVASGTTTGVKAVYGFSRAAVWIAATSALILAAPTMIQSEMAQLEEMNRQQQRSVLLGPNAGGVSPSLAQPMR